LIIDDDDDEEETNDNVDDITDSKGNSAFTEFPKVVTGVLEDSGHNSSSSQRY
jgi:hypothetical protein